MQRIGARPKSRLDWSAAVHDDTFIFLVFVTLQHGRPMLVPSIVMARNERRLLNPSPGKNFSQTLHACIRCGCPSSIIRLLRSSIACFMRSSLSPISGTIRGAAFSADSRSKAFTTNARETCSEVMVLSPVDPLEVSESVWLKMLALFCAETQANKDRCVKNSHSFASTKVCSSSCILDGTVEL